MDERSRYLAAEAKAALARAKALLRAVEADRIASEELLREEEAAHRRLQRFISNAPSAVRRKPVPPRVKPIAAPMVSAPIAANFDDAAIFELLAQVGCRMPEREG